MPTLTKISDSQLLKQWQQDKRIIIAIQEEQSIGFIIEEEGKEPVRVSDLDIIGLPKSLITDSPLLKAFLNETYVKVSPLSDGSFKVRVLQKGKGGGNTIDPVNEVEKLWPNGIVYYEISTEDYPIKEKSQERSIIQEAIDEWNASNNGFRFEPRTHEEKNFLVFDKAQNKCYSKVGMKGNKQFTRCDIGEGSGFNKGSIKHEMGHVIGLYHEQSRLDRDAYVKINTSNSNYSKKGTPHEQYDYDSMMHYPLSSEMRLNVRLPQGAKVGQREHFSEGDLAAIAYLARVAKNPDTFKEHAIELKNKGKHDQALDYFKTANDVHLTQFNSKDLECQYEVGMAHLALTQREEAKKAFTAIINEASFSYPDYKGLARQQLEEIKAIEKKEAEAAAKLRQGTIGNSLSLTSQSRFFPVNYQPSGGLASRRSTLTYQHTQEVRIPEWKRILNKANKYYQRGDYEDALTYFLTLEEEYGACLEKICDKFEFFSNLGDCHYKVEEWKNALSAFHEAYEYAEKVGKNYDRSKFRNKMGLCHSKLGQLLDAQEAYKDAVEIDPYNKTYKKNLEIIETRISNLNRSSASLRYSGPR